jgi:hypothetical protein
MHFALRDIAVTVGRETDCLGLLVSVAERQQTDGNPWTGHCSQFAAFLLRFNFLFVCS